MPLMKPANGPAPSILELSEPTITLRVNADGLVDVPESCIARLVSQGWVVAAAPVRLAEPSPEALVEQLIAAEVAKQNDATKHLDVSKGQMLGAAVAQASAIFVVNAAPEIPRERAFAEAELSFYPKDWSGFRDEGSDIANLIVAAALLRNEVRRRLRR